MREIRTSGSMSGDGKRSNWHSLKQPRLSSTLPQETRRVAPTRVRYRGVSGLHADIASAFQHDPNRLHKELCSL
jgi:hypothetical protein